jgi:ATP-dependent DNA helicase RecG
LPEGLTIEKLLANDYKSTPRNKLIAEFFKNLGWIEKYGSGIGQIIDYFKDENLPLPEFRLQSGGFLVTVFIPEIENDTEKLPEKLSESREKGREKSREKSREKIIKLIENNVFITQNEIAGLLGLSIKGVEKNIRQLKQERLLAREGADKGGYWKILKKENEQ